MCANIRAYFFSEKSVLLGFIGGMDGGGVGLEEWILGEGYELRVDGVVGDLEDGEGGLVTPAKELNFPHHIFTPHPHPLILLRNTLLPPCSAPLHFLQRIEIDIRAACLLRAQKRIIILMHLINLSSILYIHYYDTVKGNILPKREVFCD